MTLIKTPRLMYSSDRVKVMARWCMGKVVGVEMVRKLGSSGCRLPGRPLGELIAVHGPPPKTIPSGGFEVSLSCSRG